MLHFCAFIGGNVLALFMAGWLHGEDQKKHAENHIGSLAKVCPIKLKVVEGNQ